MLPTPALRTCRDRQVYDLLFYISRARMTRSGEDLRESYSGRMRLCMSLNGGWQPFYLSIERKSRHLGWFMDNISFSGLGAAWAGMASW